MGCNDCIYEDDCEGQCREQEEGGKMERLTDRWDNGTIGVFRYLDNSDLLALEDYIVDIEDLEVLASFNIALEKLEEYENTNLKPDEIEDIINILNENNDGWGNEEILGIILELAQYKKTGLTPKEIEKLKISDESKEEYMIELRNQLKAVQKEDRS